MKKIIALLLASLMAVCLLSACGGGGNTSSQGKDNQENGGIVEYPFADPITMLDNEFINIQITGKMYVDPDNSGDWMSVGGAVGYSYIIENKTPDASIMVSFASASIDGFMLDFQAGPVSTIDNFDAGKKGTGYFYIPLDGRNLGVDIQTIDDLHDFDGTIQLSFDVDGKGYSIYYDGDLIPTFPIETMLP